MAKPVKKQRRGDLSPVRPKRCDTIESSRVAQELGMSLNEMLRTEVEVAGKVFQTRSGRLLILDSCTGDVDEDLNQRHVRQELARALVAVLSHKQRMVIVSRYLEGRSMDETAKELNITSDYAGRLHNQALVKLSKVASLKALSEAIQ